MNESEKLIFLRDLNTKTLVENMHKFEDELSKELFEDARNRNLNSGFLASYGEDCREVKDMLAEVATKCPLGPAGKAMTVADKENWLRQQRKQNGDLASLINRQNNVTFETENARIRIQLATKKLDNIKTVLVLKTAQINFLAGN